MRRALIILTALALAGCHPTPGPAASTGSVASDTGSLQLTLRVPPEALPGYQTATIPGGSATIVALLSNAALLGAPRSVPVTLVGGQTFYTVTMAGLPVGAGYTLEAEARNGSGARLAFTNQLDPTSSDPALGQLRTVNPFTNPAQSFSIASGVNNVNAGLRILPLNGTTTGPTAGGLTGNAGVITGFKRPLTVSSTPEAPAGYVTTLTLNTAALVTANKLRSDMADLHVLYWDGSKYVELYREVENPNTATSQIRFPLQKAIAAAGSDANYFLTYGNNMAAPAPSDRSQIYSFFEGFEYTDAVTSRGWTVFGGSSTSQTSTLQARSGARSLQINTAGGDWCRDLLYNHTFPATFVMTAWFYDDLDPARNDWIAAAEFSNTYLTFNRIGVSQANIANNNFHFWLTNGTAWSDSARARTAGWHKYEFYRSGGTTSFLVDGTQIGSSVDTLPIKTIYLRGGGAGSSAFSSTAYWDDLSVRPLVSPEPGVAVGGEQAL